MKNNLNIPLACWVEWNRWICKDLEGSTSDDKIRPLPIWGVQKKMRIFGPLSLERFALGLYLMVKVSLYDEFCLVEVVCHWSLKTNPIRHVTHIYTLQFYLLKVSFSKVSSWSKNKNIYQTWCDLTTFVAISKVSSLEKKTKHMSELVVILTFWANGFHALIVPTSPPREGMELWERLRFLLSFSVGGFRSFAIIRVGELTDVVWRCMTTWTNILSSHKGQCMFLCVCG